MGVGEFDCPRIGISMLGSGDLRMHCGEQRGRHIVFCVQQCGVCRYIYHSDGDDGDGIVEHEAVTAAELRKWIEWVGGKG